MSTSRLIIEKRIKERGSKGRTILRDTRQPPIHLPSVPTHQRQRFQDLDGLCSVDLGYVDAAVVSSVNHISSGAILKHGITPAVGKERE